MILKNRTQEDMNKQFGFVFQMLFVTAVWGPSLLQAGVPAKFAKQSEAWFKTEEGRLIADNVVSWQSVVGSWPKNGDTASKLYEGDPSQLKGTFDNGATTGELVFLARVCQVRSETRYKESFLKGLDHILLAQYPTGGWPQRYPPGRDYHRHITFNDNTMVKIMGLLRDVSQSGEYHFVDPDRRSSCKSAFDRGIECILKTQIVRDGQRMGWCAQHDEVDLIPRPARAFELVSISGAESAGILRMLMSLDNPTPEVRRAIESGCAWFETSKIVGVRIEEKNGDTVVVEDATSSPLWARFYDTETNQPFFCGRDGIKKNHLSEIDPERRNGYSWYGKWGNGVLDGYKKWLKKWGAG